MERDLNVLKDYLDSVGAYYTVPYIFETIDGTYFYIREGTSETTNYMLRVKDGFVFNYRNEILNK